MPAVKARVLESAPERFTVTDVRRIVDASDSVIRGAIRELVDAGQVLRLAPVADYAGPGRAPIQYARAEAAAGRQAAA